MRLLLIFGGVLTILLLAGCSYDAQTKLDEAFLNADEIVVTTILNAEEITSIKFTYPTEEKEELKQGILAYTGEKANCGEANGRMVFYQKGKYIFEMQFHIDPECNSIWIKDGLSEYGFPMDTSLTALLQSRIDFVKQLKGGIPSGS